MATTTREESRATTRDVQLLRQRRRKRIAVYSNLLSVAVEGYDQQRWHSDARAKRHCERDKGSGTAKEEVAVTQRRKAISQNKNFLQRADADNNGVINKGEIRKFLEDGHFHFKGIRVHFVMKNADLNRNGVIDGEEAKKKFLEYAEKKHYA
ncbi:hypothetical protein BHM03_00025775 [Ensete ventricosum]|nr:hypothetical protein BHM03_00025775 [Ensete ventricosum]